MTLKDCNYLQHLDSIESFVESRSAGIINIDTDEIQLSIQLNGFSELIVNVKTCTIHYLKRLLNFLIPVCKTNYIRTICIRTSSETIHNYCLSNHFQENRFKKIKLDNEVLADYIIPIMTISTIGM